MQSTINKPIQTEPKSINKNGKTIPTTATSQAKAHQTKLQYKHTTKKQNTTLNNPYNPNTKITH